MTPDTATETVRAAVASAEKVVVVTGAGISASAGLATYRQRGSAWTNGDLETKMHASRYGNHLPELWGFWGALRATALAAGPTPAHLALADPRVTVLTQNVDGLHTLAGSSTTELHGSVLRTRCLRCKTVYEDHHSPASGVVPTCQACGHLKRTRVDVVLFGENLRRANVNHALTELKAADVCLYVGTSGNVWPVADFVTAAKRAGATTALVNLEPWDHPHPDFDHVCLGPSDEVVPFLMGRSLMGH